MQEGEQDFADSSAYLSRLVQEIKPDLLHLNHVGYGSLRVSVPRVVVAHGDLIGWWMAVHGHPPKQSRWLDWYTQTVTRGLSDATAVVAPSQWMRDSLRQSYSAPRRDLVIYNGRNPIFFNPYVGKDDSVLAVGRLLDAGKQVSLLTHHVHALPVCIVGTESPAQASGLPIRTDVTLATDVACVALRGAQTEAQLRSLYSRASIFAATSRYEPFGITALEAAFSRCAIVANDIPSFREIWGGDAIYFRSNDASSLAKVIQRLSQEPDLCREYAGRAYQRARERFTSKRMIDEYLQLYFDLLRSKAIAA
jgi:glycogen synthase